MPSFLVVYDAPGGDEVGPLTLGADSVPKKKKKKTTTRKPVRQEAQPTGSSERNATIPVASHIASRTTQSWWAWGWIVGPALPVDTFRIGDAEVVRVIDPDLRAAQRSKRNIVFVSGIEHGHQVIPPRVVVHSEWQTRWIFDAPDRGAADRHVRTILVPRLLAVLNTLFDERYRIELRRLGATVGGRMTDSAGFCDLAEFSGVTVHALDEDIVQLAERRLETIGSSSAASQAAEYFRRALQAADLVSEPLVGYAPLIGFHLCIESILKDAGRSTRTTEEMAADRADVIDRLRSALMEPGTDVEESAKTVIEAKLALDRISNALFRDRLAAATQLLSIDNDTQSRLEAFYRFRNDHLGHPNKVLADPEMSRWVVEATHLARVVLAAYIDYLAGAPQGEPLGEAKPLGELEELTSREMSNISVNFPSLPF